MGGVGAPEERCRAEPFLDGGGVAGIPAETIPHDLEFAERHDFLRRATSCRQCQQGFRQGGEFGFRRAFQGHVRDVDVGALPVTEDALDERGVGLGVGGQDEDVPRADGRILSHGGQEFVAQYLDFPDDAMAAMDRDGGSVGVTREIKLGFFIVELRDALLEGTQQCRGEEGVVFDGFAEVPGGAVDELRELVLEVFGRLPDEVGAGRIQVFRQLLPFAQVLMEAQGRLEEDAMDREGVGAPKRGEGA